MYVSASILTIMEVDRFEMFQKLQEFDFEVAIVSVICNCVVIAALVFRRKLNSLLHRLTFVLMLHNIVQCISVCISYSYLDQWDDDEMPLITLYIQACAFTFGVYGARLTSSCLAIAIWLYSRNYYKIIDKFH